jgi:hypothetical protein
MLSERTRLRQQVIASAPRWYSPRGHLLLTSLLGLVPMTIALALLDDVGAFDLAAAVVILLLVCHVEHWAHRHVLHERVPLLGRLYDEHTPEHHTIFLTDDMAIQSLAEARLVLMPASGIAALLAAVAPLAFALSLAGAPNLGALLVAISAGYITAYEWVHLAAHLPDTSRIARLPAIRFLRRHHAIHHHPTRMRRCNFNVACPLFDLVRGTLVTQIASEPVLTPSNSTVDR